MPRKKIHKVADVCKLIDVQPYVLRYWETEFPFLRPESRRSGARGYSDHEIELVGRVKALLYEEGYTIAGAKKKLEAELADGGPVAGAVAGTDAGTGDGAGDGSGKRAAASAGAAAAPRLRAGVVEALRQARDLLARLS